MTFCRSQFVREERLVAQPQFFQLMGVETSHGGRLVRSKPPIGPRPHPCHCRLHCSQEGTGQCQSIAVGLVLVSVREQLIQVMRWVLL